MSAWSKGRILAAALCVAGAGCACAQKAAPAAKTPAAKPSVSAKFLLEYQSQGNGDVRKDSQFEPLLRRTLPQSKFFGWGLTLAKGIDTFLNVGTGLVTMDDGRYAVVTGCVAHMCNMDRGLLWVDTQSAPPNVLFVAIDPVDDSQGDTGPYEVWIYGSQTLHADGDHLAPLPDDFMKQLEDFAGGPMIASATFVEPDSTHISLSPAQSLHLVPATTSGQPGSAKGTP